MDCHSPGQGLMPASFKVRTVPLDGDNTNKDILHPDFGEAAIFWHAKVSLFPNQLASDTYVKLQAEGSIC
ncbi:hypothetical protein L1987_48473 [Smallanthus sonchifolius]|uniref:Uncharacterized protein n=1 Tax=Smallanthus sonchifolius TaxID=185202 RepID=A0ACB9FRF0_9ASTR|nr:hypothetical protein L1987_48473 [Smallanthus sonchifolius]